VRGLDLEGVQGVGPVLAARVAQVLLGVDETQHKQLFEESRCCAGLLIFQSKP
jgi:hypothetical protein